MRKMNNPKEADSDEDEGDMELALITKTIKKFRKKHAPKEGSFGNYKGNSSKDSLSNSKNIEDVECFNLHERGHCSNWCLKKDEPENKKEKALVADSWGDMDSDADYEEQKTRFLLANKEKICDSETLLKNNVFELKRIIDFQAETIKNKEDLVEFQHKTMQDGYARMNEMREEIDYLK